MSNSYRNSILMMTDSYKVSMWKQYPPGTEYVYSYIESRGGLYKELEFFGLQGFIKEYLLKPITQKEIDFADMVWTAHGEPFNRAGWEYILEKHNGYLPLKISAVQEGMVIPAKNVLATIVNTDPECFWLTTWVETAILRAIWYPTTVATRSWNIRNLILQYLEKSGDPSTINFKLQDFGFRGVSSNESGAIGGSGHLATGFMGTDTIGAVLYLMEFYNAPVSGFSIPAAEHSTITSWGKEREIDAYRNMVNQFGKPGALLAVVSDSYDIYEACRMWGGPLKDEVIKSGATVIVRPDSGDPVVVLPQMLKILAESYGYTKNEKGYKVLNNVRIIWGDGINQQSIEAILRMVVDVLAYSADNIAFGMGGALLQQLDRDTNKWAMKCSAAGIREQYDSDDFDDYEGLVWVDVFKDPITDSGKTSKKGLVKLWKCGSEYESSVQKPTRWVDNGFDWVEVLEPVFENGKLLRDMNIDQIRANANM